MKCVDTGNEADVQNFLHKMQLSVKNKGRRLGAKRNCLDAGDVVRGSAIFFLAKVLTSLTFVSAFHLPGKCRGGYQPGGINVGVIIDYHP